MEATQPLGRSVAEQWRRFRRDIERQVFGKRVRWLMVPFTEMTWILVLYRFERAMYVAFGRRWRVIRVPLVPLLTLLHPWIDSCELSYEADIGGGLAILHPSLGVVIPGGAVVGEDVVFTGGNCLGQKVRGSKDVRIGDRVTFGVNAVALAPLKLGSDIIIGAGAVVVNDFAGPGRLAGMPAAPIADKEAAPTLGVGGDGGGGS